MVEPVTATLVVLAAAGVAAGGTKTGRAATGNAARAGYKATGWRTPSKALAHHSGRAGAVAGRLTGKAARGTRALVTRGAKATGRGAKATGRGTARAARTGTGRMANRWADRTARGGTTPRPPITWPTRSKPDDTSTGPDVRPGATPDAVARQADPEKYRVTALPDGHPDQRHFALTVEQRGGGTWAVRRGSEVLNRDGDWELEPSPSNRDEEFLARTRFSRDDALAAATREAPRIVVNGKTPADILARDAARTAPSGGAGDPQTGPTPGPSSTGAAASGAGDPATAAPETAPPPRTAPVWVEPTGLLKHHLSDAELKHLATCELKYLEHYTGVQGLQLPEHVRSGVWRWRREIEDATRRARKAARQGAAESAPPSPQNTTTNSLGPADPAGTTPDARVRAERSTTVRNRYTINLEMPSSDAEFLESCVHLGDVLKNIAEEIGEWASSLSGLNLPQSVIQPLDSISEGLVEAAGGASQAAKSFEDEFEDAREVASRGMTITGQDAA